MFYIVIIQLTKQNVYGSIKPLTTEKREGFLCREIPFIYHVVVLVLLILSTLSYSDSTQVDDVSETISVSQALMCLFDLFSHLIW